MNLVAELDRALAPYATIKECAQEMRVREDALRMYLRLHPEIEVRRVGRTVLVRRDSLAMRYEPKSTH
jgi:hypothetical protein